MEVYNEAVFDLLVPPSDIHEKLQVIKKGKETVIQVCTDNIHVYIYVPRLFLCMCAVVTLEYHKCNKKFH